MYEMFDHTADLGMRVEASSLNELFQDAARGLSSMIVENIEAIRDTETQTIETTSDDLEYLMFDWLAELLYRFEAQGWIGARFDVAVSDLSLTATIYGETFDRDRHQPAHEVKAITYHGLLVENKNDKWRAELIVDI
jgi:SHS2 domain-containing protein